MTQTPSSSSSSSSSDSFEDASANKIKFLCSHSGRILPRPSDGKLRYVGGETRVVAVDRRGVSFPELKLKMEQLCGWSSGPVSLRCQLPAEDLDALVSVTSDEDLSNLVEEYHHHAAASSSPPPLKIRAFLHVAPPAVARHPPAAGPMAHRRLHRVLLPSGFCGRYAAAPCYNYHHNHHHHHQQYLVHHGNLRRTHQTGCK